MRYLTALQRALPLVVAFGAGLALMPGLQRLLSVLPDAKAQAASGAAVSSTALPGLVPTIIDVAALKESDLGATPFPELRAKGLVTTPNATLAVQIGTVAKHLHTSTDEIQYIVEGTGTAWLGGEKREIRPGMLIVVPRGTPHAGNEATSGKFKTIAIKIPPQDPKDQTFLN